MALCEVETEPCNYYWPALQPFTRATGVRGRQVKSKPHVHVAVRERARRYPVGESLTGAKRGPLPNLQVEIGLVNGRLMRMRLRAWQDAAIYTAYQHSRARRDFRATTRTPICRKRATLLTGMPRKLLRARLWRPWH